MSFINVESEKRSKRVTLPFFFFFFPSSRHATCSSKIFTGLKFRQKLKAKYIIYFQAQVLWFIRLWFRFYSRIVPPSNISEYSLLSPLPLARHIPSNDRKFFEKLESKFRFLIESSSLNESPLFAKSIRRWIFHRLEKYPFKNILMPSLSIKNSNFRENLYIEAI